MSDVLVFGATGVIGKVLTNALLNAKDDLGRIAIFTSARTVSDKRELVDSFKARGAEVIIGDVDRDEDVVEAYRGFDTIVSAVGRNAIAKQLDLIRLTEHAPTVKRFLPSEFGTDVAYDSTSATERTQQAKLRVRAYLESDAVRSRLTHTYIVTGPFAELYVAATPSDARVGSFDAVNKSATLLGDGAGRISLTTVADVGRALVAALRNPGCCDGKAMRVTSFTTTPRDIVAEMERQTEGRWKVKYTPVGELKALEEEAWEKGSALAALFTLRRIWTEGRTLYERWDNEEIGLVKMDTLEMVVQARLMT